MRIDKVKKKYLSLKKNKYLQSNAERSNEVITEDSVLGSQNYPHKYLNSNEINWGDTNSYPSFSGKDSFIHMDDEETMKR